MYYIQNGLGKNWKWLAIFFCIGTICSALVTGGALQANSVTQSAIEASTSLGIDLPRWVVGAVLAFLVFVVIVGGIKSIGVVAGRVVPFMAVAYILVGLVILATHASEIPGAFALIFTEAFGFREAAGGFAGYVIMAAVRAGVARGLFSNEAGQGSAPIAHAAAQTSNPVKQGEIAMLGVFIDTMIICTMTALVILTVSGSYANLDGSIVEFAWQSDALSASAVTTAAFAEGIYAGAWIILAAQGLFAFTTIIGWSYYAETSATYIVGDWAARPFRFMWVGVAFLGTLVVNVDGLWRFGDVANSMMLFPNVIAILLLAGVVLRYTHDYDRKGIVPPAWYGADAVPLHVAAVGSSGSDDRPAPKAKAEPDSPDGGGDGGGGD